MSSRALDEGERFMICVQFPRLLRLLGLLLAASIGTIPVANAQTEQPPPPAAQITPDPWPKLREIAGVKYTLYQPQVDKRMGMHVTHYRVLEQMFNRTVC